MASERPIQAPLRYFGSGIFPGSLKSSAQYGPIMAMARLFPK